MSVVFLLYTISGTGNPFEILELIQAKVLYAAKRPLLKVAFSVHGILMK